MKAIAILLILATQILAGSRTLSNIAITNATTGKEPDTSKRLYELLISDTKVTLLQSETFGFAWEPGIKLNELPTSSKLFNNILTPLNPKNLQKLINDTRATDGLIVYQYDTKNNVARLKFFDADGTELILIKLPLDKDGPMKGSIQRHTRRAAIVAVGGAIPFIP